MDSPLTDPAAAAAPAGPGFRPAVARAAAALVAIRGRIAVQHAAGSPGIQACGLAAEMFDAAIVELWESVVADLPDALRPAVRDRVAVVAHGGYGRRQMAPGSDVDLMLLHDGSASARQGVAAAAKRLLQDLCDAGFTVGQSVRSVGEAGRLAAGDATILSSLLDSRPLAGAAGLVPTLAARLRKGIARGRRRAARRLLAARREEADRHGGTVALLEPNVKRSRGGLRDIQLVHWLGIVLHDVGSPDDLALAGVISRPDAAAIREAEEFLVRVRNDLHLAAGKPADDLTRDQQLRSAQARGIESEGGLLGVERFMRDYFGHTRRVARVVESLEAGVRGPARLRSLASGLLGHEVDGLYRVGPGGVAAIPGRIDRVAGSVAGVLRLVELAALYDLPIDQATWEAVRSAAPHAPGALDPAARDTFLALFSRPESLGQALRRLHEVGVLEVLIPGFTHARDLLQFNNYHKYTVDEHCIVAVEQAVNFAASDGWLGATWRQLNRKRPLLLTLLIHDLGKGFEEDHSLVGARIARDVAARLALPADEAEIVEFLVLRHLAMAHLAFRRDVGDAGLVVRFACDVGSPEVLRMLSLLTAADVSAVGPGTWTKWKADLLGDLHYRALGHLDGEAPSLAADHGRRELAPLLADRDPDDPVVRIARRLPAAVLRDTPVARVVEELGRLARLPVDGVFAAARWQAETGTVVVSVGTREQVAPGIFHRVTGALAAQRLEILAADIHTLDDGIVLDHFTALDPDYAGEPPADRLADIAAAIRVAVKADQPPVFNRVWNPFAPRVAPAGALPVRVAFDIESSAETTIVEVFAHDSPGLLYGIARALFDAGLSVRSARIGTYLDQVVDAFHVTDRQGRKVTDPVLLAAVRGAIERAATPLTAPA